MVTYGNANSVFLLNKLNDQFFYILIRPIYFQQSSFIKLFDWAYTNEATVYATGEFYFSFTIYYTGQIEAWPGTGFTAPPQGICMIETVLPHVA